MATVAIIDSDDGLLVRVGRHLERRGYRMKKDDLEAAQVVIVDLALPDAIDIVRKAARNAKVICTHRGRIDRVVEAVKAGATEVVDKGLDAPSFYRLLERVKPADIGGVPKQKARPVDVGHIDADLIVANDPRTQKAIASLEAAARDESWVTIVCEPLLAEQLARRFHEASPRSDGEMIVVPKKANGHTPAETLFGTASHPSAFERARGGIVFVESLESLGAKGREHLAKLLRGLEESTSVRWPPIIIATDEEPVIDPRVERDLADVLARRTVVVPRLHARRSDLTGMIDNVVAGIVEATDADGSDIDAEVMEALSSRSYTGGVQELLDLVTRSAGINDRGQLVLSTRRTKVSAPRPESHWTPTLDGEGGVRPYEDYEAEIFRFALERSGGCVSRAAKLLKVGRATMYRKMRTYEIDVPPVSERSIRRGRRDKVQAGVE